MRSSALKVRNGHLSCKQREIHTELKINIIRKNVVSFLALSSKDPAHRISEIITMVATLASQARLEVVSTFKRA